MHISIKYFVFGIAFLLCCKVGNAQNLGNLAKEKPVVINGDLSMQEMLYNANGIKARNPSSAFVASANLNLSVYGFQMPFSFSYANTGNSFNQPFNQFGISPTYKWATLHLGYRNLSFNPFTLSGHTILGIGAELKPGKLRAAFMYGRFNKATAIDTLSQNLVPVSYTRKGFAGRLGYGSDNNFFEFSFLKATDDTTSLLIDKAKYNASLYPNAFASENIVAGLTQKYTFFKHIILEANVAASIYTRDIQSPLVITDSNTKILTTLQKFIRVNGTSSFSTALQGAIGYKSKKMSLKFQYKRIAPQYNSMGIYVLTTDVENYTFAPTFSLLKNKINVNGSIGFQKDNLAQLKASTSKRTIGNANLSAFLTKNLGLDLSYNNYTTDQQPNTTRFNNTLRITQSTYSVSATPRYMINNKDFNHLILFSWYMNKLNDFNDSYASGQSSSQLTSQNVMLNYQITPAKWAGSAGLSITYFALNSALTQDKNYAITQNIDKSFFKKNLTLRESLTYTNNKTNSQTNNIINGTATAEYRLYKRHRLGCNMYYTNYKPKEINPLLQGVYSEFRSTLFYNYRF